MYTTVKGFLDSWITKVLISLLAAANGYIALCISTDSYGDGLKKGLGDAGIYIINHGGSIIFTSALLAGAYPHFYTWIEKNAENLFEKYKKLEEKYDISMTILEKIDYIVEKKRLRFAELATKIKSTPQGMTPKTVFKSLTQPDQQIKIIIDSLLDCLKKIYKNETIKVALMNITNAQLDKWEYHAPYDTKPRTEVSVLKDPRSTISRSLAAKNLIIVPDTKVELDKINQNDRMFIQGNTGRNEKWCQVCYPIISINTNEVIFIISIAIKRENVFNAAHETYLTWLLKFFGSRLALEHSLREIKDRTS